MERLNSIRKKYKHEDKKNKILKVNNSTLELENNIQEIKVSSELKINKKLKKQRTQKKFFGVLKCQNITNTKAKKLL